MNKNDKPHDKFHPYKLLLTDGHAGCFEEYDTAKRIGRAEGYYQILHYQRGLIDSSD